MLLSTVSRLTQVFNNYVLFARNYALDKSDVIHLYEKPIDRLAKNVRGLCKNFGLIESCKTETVRIRKVQ